MMGSMFVLYTLVYFGASFAALMIPDNVLRRPLNFSTTTIAPGNHTLGAWPPIGTSLRLGDDLSIEFEWYGDYAPRNKWNDIRVAFDDIRNRVENYPYWSTSGHRLTYRSGYIYATLFYFVARGQEEISAVEAAKVVEAIQGFAFTYDNGPRELQIEIRKARRLSTMLNIKWASGRSREWPLNLPFNAFSDSHEKIEIYSYGRDAEPSSINGIHVTLSRLIYGFNKKHDWWHEMKHYTYSNEYVKLIAEGVVSGDTEDRMTWRDLYMIIRYGTIDSYFAKGLGPRELALRYMKLHGQVWREVGKVFIYFTDPDSTERAIE